MADEITTVIGLSIVKGLLREDVSTESLQFDFAGTIPTKNVQPIGSGAHEALTVSPDISTAGVGWFYNISEIEGEDISIGIDATGTFHAFCKLAPGQMQLVWLATKDVYAKSATGTPNLHYLIAEA